jgi:hypothetical protein
MSNKPTIVKTEVDQIVPLREFESGILKFLGDYGLPTEKIFVNVPERVKVFENLDSVINKIDDLSIIKDSFYLSKYLAATASGLFDAALNYLWDETILQIRRRVSKYDLEFFYDNTVGGERRSRFTDENDLVDLQDSELIRGAKEIGLISEIGFQHLEFINYMRNWASAAHPNQAEITGLQLIAWLETCIREVITLPLNATTIRIKELLSNIRRNALSIDDAEQITLFFERIPKDQTHNLILAFFGIYTRPETDQSLKTNINLLSDRLWQQLNDSSKNEIGLKYANFAAHGVTPQKELAREFIEIVNGQSYIPDDLRVVEIVTALEDLMRSHRGFNNFYNEPAFARELKRVVGDYSKVPKSIEEKYILNLVEVFLSNGHGVASSANTIYEELIGGMSNGMAEKAFLSFNDELIRSKLQFELCKRKFLELSEICKSKITSKAFLEFMSRVLNYKIPLDKLYIDSRIKREIEIIKQIRD